jgi:hypothetical protein
MVSIDGVYPKNQESRWDDKIILPKPKFMVPIDGVYPKNQESRRDDKII